MLRSVVPIRHPARGTLACCLVLACATAAQADLTFPASFEITEEAPGRFRISLTLPLIQGRFLKARPVFPDIFRIDRDPVTRAGSGTLTRTWQAQADPGSLPGAAFGLAGLLGTSQEVRFDLSTLDGRRYGEVLRPTRAFFVVPRPPGRAELVAEFLRDGLRRTVRHVGLWLLLAAFVLAGGSQLGLYLLVIASAVGMFPICLGGNLAAGPGLPMAVSGLPAAAAAVAVGAGSGTGTLRPVRTWTWIGLAAATGLIAAWAGLPVVAREGLSDRETRLASGLLLGGWLAGGITMAVTLQLAESLLPESSRRRAARILALCAATWGLYQAAGLIRVYGPGWLAALENAWVAIVYRWFSPFTADWAMARLRVPWPSLCIAVFAIWSAVRLRHGRRVVVAAGLLVLGIVLLPWGASRVRLPFMSPRAPSPAQAHRILEPMLAGIYHALNLQDEGQAYDKLAEQVSGDLITDLYLDSRRRLIAGTRGGASVVVRRVMVEEVGTPRTTGADSRSTVYPCRWTVLAKVTHWQHSHERRNVYQGNLRLAVENDHWKLAGLDLRSEEREVVPGSFSSAQIDPLPRLRYGTLYVASAPPCRMGLWARKLP